MLVIRTTKHTAIKYSTGGGIISLDEQPATAKEKMEGQLGIRGDETNQTSDSAMLVNPKTYIRSKFR